MSPQVENNNEKLVESSMEEHQYLVGFNPPSESSSSGKRYITFDQNPPTRIPTFPGTLEEFGEKYGINVWNDGDAKRCDNCGKTCSTDQAACNACNVHLGDEVELTHNCLLGFVYGVASIGGKFGRDLTFSSRYESKDVFVFDDALARSPMHFCAVPTKIIRTVREFVLRPDAAEILDLMEDASIKAFDNRVTAEWLENVNTTYSELKESLCFGFNAKPSQYQLHLHCIAPSLMPQDNYLTKQGIRFNEGRWLPLKYVRALIELASSVGLDPDFDMFKVVEQHGGESYIDMLSQQRKDFTSERIKFWSDEWFTHKVINDKVIDIDGNVCEGTPSEWAQRDKLVMQNCGRPYVDGRVQPVSYFSHAVVPSNGTIGCTYSSRLLLAPCPSTGNLSVPTTCGLESASSSMSASGNEDEENEDEEKEDEENEEPSQASGKEDGFVENNSTDFTSTPTPCPPVATAASRQYMLT